MTAFQYRWFGAFLLWLLIVPAVLTVFTLYVFLLVAPSATVSHAAARAVAVLVSATLTLQLLVWGLRLKQLSHGIEGVLTSARSVLKANDVLSDQAVVLAGEYNLLISHGVFIPQWVYEHLRDEVTGHEKTPSSEP
jgi:ABC-type multidrug transport system fused ATPase/permease subunit